MSSYRKIYNQIGLFAATCPATGGHFLDYSGNLTTSMYSIVNGLTTGYSYNLINSIRRVYDIGYGFNQSRIDIKNLGNFGTVARPAITIPPISLQFSYYSYGLLNEARLGFIINTQSGNIPTNPPIYSSNICPISGFLDRTFQKDYSNSFVNVNNINEYWLSTYRDCKNFFVATIPNGDDLNKIQPVTQTLNNTTGKILKDNIYLYSFGDCYLNTYKFAATVGNFPQATADYICYNAMWLSGGSGNNIPSVNPKDGTLRSGTYYNLPPIYTGQQDSVILPGDISFNISETGNPLLFNFPIDFSDIKIQGFDYDISLNREPLQNLGYKLPLDRRINFPIYCNLNMNAIVGDNSTGSFIDFINKDTEYNIIINMKYSNLQFITGTAINLKFLSCKLNNFQISDSIQDKRTVTASFTTEINPNYSNRGFFMSGQLGIPSSNSPQY